MWLLQNYVLTPPAWGSTACNLPCQCPNFSVYGFFEGIDSLPGICGSPTALGRLWRCHNPGCIHGSCADHQRSTYTRRSGRAGPAAHVLEWGSVHALKISWAPQDLGLMEHVQQAWLCSQTGYLYFMCAVALRYPRCINFPAFALSGQKSWTEIWESCL